MERIRLATTGAADTGARCAECGAAFTCGMAAGEAACWCAALPHVLPAPEQGSDCTCLCPACLQSAINASANPRPAR